MLRSSLFALVSATCLLGVALAQETPQTPAVQAAQTERKLFDGNSLDGWKIANFGGEGDVYVEDGKIVLDYGSPLTGITCTRADLPTSNYEISLEAQRLEGSDFFCGLTFPVQQSHCSLILGGWGGSLVGLSSIDGADAARNDTARNVIFKRNTWYRVRVRVSDRTIQVWLDDEQIIDQSLDGKKISIRPEVSLSRPLGITSFETRAAIRDVRLQEL